MSPVPVPVPVPVLVLAPALVPPPQSTISHYVPRRDLLPVGVAVRAMAIDERSPPALYSLAFASGPAVGWTACRDSGTRWQKGRRHARSVICTGQPRWAGKRPIRQHPRWAV